MKDMDDDSGSGSGSEKDSEEETEEEEEGEEEESGGSLPEYDVKLSHNSWQYDKKKKVFTCTTGWYTAVAKKPTDKFTVECITNVGSYMVGFINKIQYNQSQSNYNTGHYWYCSSTGLYGQGNRLSFSAGAGSNQGTKIGCLFDRKKINYFILQR